MWNNQWQDITLICGNHGTDYSNQMKLVKQGGKIYYACSCNTNPESGSRSGKTCRNRLSLLDFEKMLNKIEENEGDIFFDVCLEGFHWKQNRIEYLIIADEYGHYTVRIYNGKTAAQ